MFANLVINLLIFGYLILRSMNCMGVGLLRNPHYSKGYAIPKWAVLTFSILVRVTNIPIMQLLTGILRNTQYKPYVPGNSEMIRCGIPLNMSYCIYCCDSMLFS